MNATRHGYFGALRVGIGTLWTGLRLTLRHLTQAFTARGRTDLTASDANYFSRSEGVVTLQYPLETLPAPDNGRYRLHNEIDDCIVCDKCAKVCPVDCIDIEPVKSEGVWGHTSDGTGKRLYAATFDIDMAKCCYCGLCTTVCPTECLTMTKTYDFSEFEVSEMKYAFAELTEEEAEAKRQAYEAAQATKKAQAMDASTEQSTEKPAAPKKGGFRPKMPVRKPKKD